MHGQYNLVQAILFFSIIGLIVGAYFLSIRKSMVMLPCSILAFFSLGILAVFVLTQPTGVWFWAGTVYAGLHASFVSLGWWMFARQPSRNWLLERLGGDLAGSE